MARLPRSTYIYIYVYLHHFSSGASRVSLQGGASFKVEQAHLLHEKIGKDQKGLHKRGIHDQGDF